MRPAAITFRTLALPFLYYYSGFGVLLIALFRYCYLSDVDFEMMGDLIIAMITVMVMIVIFSTALVSQY